MHRHKEINDSVSWDGTWNIRRFAGTIWAPGAKELRYLPTTDAPGMARPLNLEDGELARYSFQIVVDEKNIDPIRYKLPWWAKYVPLPKVIIEVTFEIRTTPE